jgi:hypothetical protein
VKAGDQLPELANSRLHVDDHAVQFGGSLAFLAELTRDVVYNDQLSDRFSDPENVTNLIIQLLLRLDVVLLQLVVELFQGFQVLDCNPHFLDTLS